MGWHTDRPADVAPDFERGHSGGKSDRRSAGGTAWRAAQIPRIVGAPKDRVICLMIAGAFRNVGLAEDHDSGLAKTNNGCSVTTRLVIAQCRRSTSRRHA